MSRKKNGRIFSLVLILLFIFLSCSKEEKKVSTAKPLPDSGFRVELRIKEIPSELKKGKESNDNVVIKNISNQTWPSKGDSKAHYQVNLGYQFFNEAGEPLATEVRRTHLLKDPKPSESIDVSVILKGLDEPGGYTVRFDMVQAAVASFVHKNKDNYSKPLDILVSP